MQQLLAAIENYAAVIRAVAQYAPKLSEHREEGASPERGYLLAVAAEVAAGDCVVLRQSQPYLSGVLREYRDESLRYLGNLRRELTVTAGTLHDITRTMAESDAQSGKDLAAGLDRLRELASRPAAQPVADAVRAATAELDRGMADMQKQHLLILSQLHAEIRLLHKRMDSLTSPPANDLARLMPREEMDHRIALLDAGTFRLLLLKADGLSRASVQQPPEVFRDLSAAFARRMRSGLPAGTAVARWSEEGFVALLTADPGQARKFAARLQELLSGPYVCRSGAGTVITRLRASVEVLDSRGGMRSEAAR